MKVEQITLISASMLAVANLLTSAITYRVLAENSHYFGNKQTCFLYASPGDNGSLFNKYCDGTKNLFLTSLITSVILIVTFATVALLKRDRTRWILMTCLIADIAMFLVALVGVCLFTVGLEETAKKHGQDLKVYAAWFSAEYNKDPILVQNALNAAAATVIFWLMMALVDGFAFYYERKNGSSLSSKSAGSV